MGGAGEKMAHILLTGATSFTGMWFARALSLRGHRVTAVMRGSEDEYRGLKHERLDLLRGLVDLKFRAAFGTQEFVNIANSIGPIDILCHHAADATNYKSLDFDVLGALHANALNLQQVMAALARAGCNLIVLTGSVFEAGEGAGDMPLRAFNPYGLSKSLTSSLFQFYAAQEGFGLSKFTIPNPFGPHEEPRFTDYLVRKWASSEVASINTPSYVRDNIHVSLLAAAYVSCVESAEVTKYKKMNPSGYVESQGAFAGRFAREIGNRLQIETPIELALQTEFPEPAVRINTMPCDVGALGWSESAAWDDAAEYYAVRFSLRHR